MMIATPNPGLEIPHGLGDTSTLSCTGIIPVRSGGTIESASDWQACWCITWPGLCSDATYAAAQSMVNPDLFYGSGPPPPVHPPAVASGLSTTPAPLTSDQYNAEIDAALAAGKAATNKAEQDYFNGVAATIQAAKDSNQPNPPNPNSIPSWVWIAAVAGIGVIVLAKK